MTTTTNTTSHFPVKAGRGKKVHWYTKHDWTDSEGNARTRGQTACNITLTNKAWSRKGGTAQPTFFILPGDVKITCERCQAAYKAHLAELAAETPEEVLTEQLAEVEETGNEFTYHFLFKLPDNTTTRKEFRKLIRKLAADQKATYTIKNGCYILSLPSGFTYKFFRTDDGAIYIERMSRPD